MLTISVASGKGGAGKTSVAAALACLLAPNCVLADCDVDAANGAIALRAKIISAKPYDAGPGFHIDAAACLGCGACLPACRFHALRAGAALSAYRIEGDLCERCGACLPRCPAGAIKPFEKKAGELFISGSRIGIPLVHAELIPGEDTSGKLVALVREEARREAGTDKHVVVDAPPGIGCPVIASLTRSDWVLLVVEASASGIRDAGRLAELLRGMGRKAAVIINKTGLNPAMDAKARALAESEDLPLAGEIPFDPALRSAEEGGKSWIELDGKAAQCATAALKGFIEILQRSTDEIRSTHG